MVALDEREARFSHLLQPIRDLAENWDIDVASGLEDYLDELESITISLDGGQTNLNFAEAALLIQGSTCIYSRKVEYLYTLVLQTLEALSTGKYGQAQRGKEGAVADAGAPGGPPADGADEDDEGDDPTLGAAAERSGVWFEATSSLLEGGRRSMNPDNSDSDDENDGPNFEPGGPAAERSMAMTESSVLLGGGGAAGQRGAGGGDVAPATPSNKAAGGGAAGPGGGAGGAGGGWGAGEEEAAAASPAGVWDLLDPHDPGPAAARRPFRKGKVVQAVPEDCYPEEEDPWAAGDYCDWDAGAAAAAGEGGGGGGARPTGLAYKEFAYVAQWDRRRRARARRALRRRAAAIAAGGGGGEGGYGSGEEGGEDDDDDVDFGDVGFDPHGGDSDDESQPPLDDPDDDWGLGGAGDGPAPQALDGAFGGIGPTYEELCKQHLEAFLSGAEAYAAAAEGGLAARVQEWQARLGPVLAEQEKRPAFDIHIYGGEIIGSLSSKAPERVQKSIKTQQHDDIDQLLLTNEVFMGFAQVTAGKEQHEICRMFLASLQLANNGNLQLVHGASAESQNDSTFGLRLKSMKAAYELLNDGDASLTQN